MIIARLINGQTEVQNILLEGGVLPDYFVDAGWTEVTVQPPEALPAWGYNARLVQALEGTVLVQSYEYESFTVDQFRSVRAAAVKNQYMDDVKWTDDSLVFYQKMVAADLAEPLATWYSEVMNYFKEARVERQANKTALNSATTLQEIAAVQYAPTHVKTKAELAT